MAKFPVHIAAREEAGRAVKLAAKFGVSRRAGGANSARGGAAQRALVGFEASYTRTWKNPDSPAATKTHLNSVPLRPLVDGWGAGDCWNRAFFQRPSVMTIPGEVRGGFKNGTRCPARPRGGEGTRCLLPRGPIRIPQKSKIAGPPKSAARGKLADWTPKPGNPEAGPKLHRVPPGENFKGHDPRPVGRWVAGPRFPTVTKTHRAPATLGAPLGPRESFAGPKLGFAAPRSNHRACPSHHQRCRVGRSPRRVRHAGARRRVDPRGLEGCQSDKGAPFGHPAKPLPPAQ